MFGLQKYKDLFGEPGKGIHKYRLFNIAIIDVILTIILAYIIYMLYYKYKRGKRNKFIFIGILIILFASSIVIHRLFGVRTTVDKLLFN